MDQGYKIILENGIFLAFIAILIESYFLLLIYKEYKRAKKSIIAPEELQLRLEQCISDPKTDDDILATELIELIGTQRSTETIRKILRQGISFS